VIVIKKRRGGLPPQSGEERKVDVLRLSRTGGKRATERRKRGRRKIPTIATGKNGGLFPQMLNRGLRYLF